MVNYARHLAAQPTQFDRLRPDQVPNNDGAFVFKVDPFERLERFLILGCDGGTYYASERQLTRENAACIVECLAKDPAATVNAIVRISQWGRAPRQGPGIFALAIAASDKNPIARKAALQALPLVCRTGRTLLEFVATVDNLHLRGWGKGLRRAVGNWYVRRDFDQLSYQLLKYRGHGKDAKRWTHRDVLRMAHPTPVELDGQIRALLRWAVGASLEERTIVRKLKSGDRQERQLTCGDLPESIAAFEQLQKETDPKAAAAVIRQHRFTHEMVPSQLKNEPAIWEALLESMPLGALVRNLGKLSSVGLVTQRSDWSKEVCQRLVNVTGIRKARLHPIAFLSAMQVYRGGHAIRAQQFSRRPGRDGAERKVLSWIADPNVTNALESSFYLAFGNVKPTGKRLCLAFDISGSMQAGDIAGVPGLTPAMAAAAMGLVTMRTEPHALCMGFSHQFVQLDIRADMPLEQAQKAVSGAFGATDCSLPFRWALDAGVRGPLQIDGFAVYTDSETNQSQEHPYGALRRYRKATGIDAKLAVIGMTATDFTIADPRDAGMLDVVGFDTSAPAIISDFFRGKAPPTGAPEEQAQEEDQDEAA